MKPKSTLRSFLCIASSALLTISYSQAATLYWDGGTANIGTPGNGVSGGAAGNWDTTLTNWDQGNALAHVAWSGTTNTAFFGGTAGTVTLTAPITVGGLGFFSNSGYIINAGTQGLTFGATTNQVRMLNVSVTTSTATISGTVTGTGNLVFTSVAADVGSTLTLNGTSAGGWSGTTTINPNFTLSLSGANQALLNTSGITLNGNGITLSNADSTAEDDLNRVNDGAVITSNGGTITYTTTTAGSTKTFIETLGSVALTTGQLNLVNTLNKSAGSQTLALSGLTRTGATNASAITFSNAGDLNLINDRIRVNGITADTATNEIIGAWATTGTAANSQSDYAIYDSDGTDGYILARNITASAETTWTTAANTYTANAGASTGGSTGLTATRAITALRSISGANSMTVDNVGDTFALTSNTFANGDAFILGGTTAPTGLTLGTTYYVVGKSGDTFQVAATSGGAAIDFTTDGTAVTATGAITLSTGNNLGTTGILNGVGNTLTILGTGEVTLPTTTPAHLHVTPGVGPITIAAPIDDNGLGVLTLVKNGNNVLTLSGTNTYTGGTVLNAGSLSIGNVNHIGGASANLTFGGTATLAPSAALNFSGGTLTVNAGAYGTITGSGATAFATTTGTGTLRYTSGSNSANLNLGNASGFTGNLQFRLTGNANYDGQTTIQFSSLGDGVGSALQVGGGQPDSSTPGQRANIVLAGGSAPLVFDNRRIEILPRIASNHTVNTTRLTNNNTATANTWTINTDLSYQVDQSRFLEFNGTNTGDNAFNGVISDGNLGGVINLRKDGTGKWIVSGNNTYTGGTTVNAGTLVLSGTNQYTGATSVSGGTLVGIGANAFGSTSGISTTNTPTLSLRGDTSTSFVKASDSMPYTLSTSTTDVTLNVDQATIAGTGAKTMTFGDITTTSTAATYEFNFTGANNTSLSVGTLSTSISTVAAVHSIDNNITGGGSLTLASVFNRATTVASPNLVFKGTGTTTITGAITQTLTDMDLIKNDAGTLLLNGVNTYTGLTSVNAGTLGGTGTIAGSVTVAATAALAPGVSTTPSAGTLSIGANLTLTEATNDVGTLKFDLGSLVNSDKIVVTGTVDVGTDALGLSDFTFNNLGGLQNGSYTLIDSGAAIAGPLAAGDLISTFGGANIELKIVGTDLVLDVTGLGAGSAYDTWKAANAPGSDPDDDTDGDGVTNAVEFVLGGTSATKDLDKLPVGSTSGANMVFTFKRAVSSIDAKTAVFIETSTDLATWNTAPSPYIVPNTATGPVNPGVTVVEDTSPGFDTVTLTVPQAPDAKKFARLKVVITP